MALTACRAARELSRRSSPGVARFLSTASVKEGEAYYGGLERTVASPWKKFEQTVDRLSYSYLMEDMWRGLFLGVEVMLKPKVRRRGRFAWRALSETAASVPAADHQLPV